MYSAISLSNLIYNRYSLIKESKLPLTTLSMNNIIYLVVNEYYIKYGLYILDEPIYFSLTGSTGVIFHMFKNNKGLKINYVEGYKNINEQSLINIVDKVLNRCYDLPIKDNIEVIQSECGFKMIDEVKVVDGYKEFPLEYITCICNNNLIDYNQVDWLYDLYEV